MAIIRSKIARQLLAEGGAPRKGFMFGSPGSAEQEASFGAQAAMSQDAYESLDQEGQAEMDQARFDAGIRSADFGNLNVNEGSDTPSFFQKTIDRIGSGLQGKRGQNILNFLNRSTAATLRGKLGLGKPGDINYVLDLLQNPDDRVYGLSNKEREIGEKLIDAGIKDEFDIRNMTQSQFDNLFPGPQTGGGGDGDNEPIKRLRAPITEAKKEEPRKGEFDDLLRFYGAKFARGGRTDAESQYGADSYGSYSFEDDGNRDNGDGPPTIDTGGGTEPPMLSGGRGIDVGALQNRGLTPAEIATVFNEYYGLDTEPTTVTGPLGTGPGGLMGTGPSIEFGQQVTKGSGTRGTTGTKGTGFDISDIQPTSGYGGVRDTQTAIALDNLAKEGLFDTLGIDVPKKADGGVIRQNYGLGSLVKKATRAVKKVLKSDLGKAAILGFGAYKLAGSPSIFGKDSFIMKNKALAGILGTSLAAGLFAKKEEEEDEKLPTVANTDPEMTKFINFYGGPTRFVADGGDIDKAPTKMASAPSSFAELNMLSIDLFGRPYDQLNDSEQEILMEYFSKSKDMPERNKDMPERTMVAGGGIMNPNDEMLDLKGNEMDLRGGGFVPLGEYEKKDDVPARLSKNEFVFTADAVRAAGGGSVDRGADIMYKTMKNLENKVA